MLGVPGRCFVLAQCAAFSLVSVAGCDLLEGGGSEKAAEKTAEKAAEKTAEKAAKDPESVVEQAVAQAEKEAGAAHLFDPEDKALRKAACEILTAEMVGEHFGVPAGDLEQVKVMGCIYNGKAGDDIVEARLTQIRAHKTLEGAKQWFGNATASLTKEQIDAQFEQVKGKLEDRKELDTEMKQNTAQAMTNVAMMGTPDEGVSYEDVSGIGDEARVSSADGNLWVRVGNLTFSVGAYAGPPQPPVPIDPKNPKAVIKASMEAQKKYLAETQAERAKAAKALAPKLVAAIAKRASG